MLSALVLLAGSMASVANAQPVAGTYELPMRTLVLATQHILSDYPVWVLNAMQQPFDLVQLVDETAMTTNDQATQVRGGFVSVCVCDSEWDSSTKCGFQEEYLVCSS